MRELHGAQVAPEVPKAEVDDVHSDLRALVMHAAQRRNSDQMLMPASVQPAHGADWIRVHLARCRSLSFLITWP